MWVSIQRLYTQQLCQNTPAAYDYLEQLVDIRCRARQQVQEAHNRQILQANKHRRYQALHVNDQVMLSTKCSQLQLPAHKSRKMSDRYIGPYKILATVGGTTYKLELPPHMAIHPIFHISLLWPYYGTSPQRPPPDWDTGVREYEVDTSYNIESGDHGMSFLSGGGATHSLMQHESPSLISPTHKIYYVIMPDNIIYRSSGSKTSLPKVGVMYSS